MARGMALAGVDPSELAPPPPIKKPEGFFEKLSNFWYHYKPHTIACLLLLLFGGWVLAETLTKNPADYSFVVVTELPLVPDEVEAFKAFAASYGEDIDGDGQVEVELENLTPYYYDEMAPTVGRSDNDKLMAHLSTGERMLFVFDEPSYNGFMETVDNVSEEGYEFFDSLPVTSPNYNAQEHYWSWFTAQETMPAFQKLPHDLRFGVRTPYGTAAGEQSVKDHQNGKALLLKMIEDVDGNH
ncbi:MAG: hypothetical protein IJD01_05035 [Clostridia bacterium]|nr:hypothetical protein [Clostridia bacterium]